MIICTFYMFQTCNDPCCNATSCELRSTAQEHAAIIAKLATVGQ